jgi:hypothetical protein
MCSSAQQLLQNNMKRNPASQTEAIMQHEITRLTGWLKGEYPEIASVAG